MNLACSPEKLPHLERWQREALTEGGAQQARDSAQPLPRLFGKPPSGSLRDPPPPVGEILGDA